ncbi:uncharacterized protein LOC131322085 isoform X2 [Rhododendron vialii]|uniref:uncharacterized protein LOC131322085 isoform X2 n=1 Tax=Rhododendron vialii TaxID=182163 RepID=UPI00265FF9C8|nr:uncharacterized protein LOC131322085 isoform X2 [Rhododendron vialii]
MESSSSSSSSSSRRPLHTHPKPTPARQKPLPNRIQSAIRGKSCPICLTHIDARTAAVITACLHAYCVDCIRKWSHLKRKCPLCNLDFDSWFFKIDPYSRTFLREKLPGLGEGRKVVSEGLRLRANHRLVEQRRSREEFNCFSGQTRPLPRQRWFGRSESESSDAVAQRVLQWRASIYEQHLQAVPFSSRSNQEQNTTRNNCAQERIEKKIEPWIRRELEAILGDPDPSVIVHVASSLFISSFEEKREVSCEQSDLVDNYLEPLRPFLHERTNMFWHELRCFAESPFTMETYDTVVEYRKWSE